jgi:pimeloyl-ACP methyl ester carboxylesterase
MGTDDLDGTHQAPARQSDRQTIAMISRLRSQGGRAVPPWGDVVAPVGAAGCGPTTLSTLEHAATRAGGAAGRAKGRCVSSTNGRIRWRQTDDHMTAIVVTGTGVCLPAALGYYAPLTNLVPETRLHVLEWWGLASIRRSVDKLVRRLQAVDTPVTLIGHSQGGMVAALASEVAPQLVDRVITICAPLGGTALAPWWSPVVSMREMSRARCATATGPWPGTPPMVNVVAAQDHLVVPYTSGLREGAEHHVVPGAGHFGIIWDARLHRLVRDVLSRRGPQATRVEAAAS